MRDADKLSRQVSFRKSSFSEATNPTTCVEVAFEQDAVLVRHSTNKDMVLKFTPAEWKAFLKGVEAGEFGL